MRHQPTWKTFYPVVVICGAMFTLLGVRLIDLQLIQGKHYFGLSEQNRYFTQQVLPSRGVFLDRFGQPLVKNYRAYYQVDQVDQVFTSRELVDRPTALALLATASAQIETDIYRRYQYPESLSHVLGYVGYATVEDLEADESLSSVEIVGKMGLEKKYNHKVAGVVGEVVFEVNAMGKKVKQVSRIEPQSGESQLTTLDPYLAEVAYRALESHKGVVTIMDVDTGAVLVSVSRPAFDANVMVPNDTLSLEEKKTRSNLIASWFENEERVFFNRAVAGTYPPGSVFKPITGLAGLEAGVIDENTSVVDNGFIEAGGSKFANWYYTQYGRVEGEISLKRALARSNNIYFYKVAEWVGPDKLAQMARLFGFGEVTELGGEVTGLVPDPIWKEQTLGERWFLGNTYHLGIGQGDMLVTPLQVTNMTQAIANFGSRCKPTLLQEDVSQCAEVGVSEAHLNLIMEGMFQACSAGGTAFPLFSYNQNRDSTLSVRQQLANGALLCKTGTADTGRLAPNGTNTTHGWLIAVVGVEESLLKPADVAADPLRAAWIEKLKLGYPKRLAITVLVESDEDEPFKEGSTHATPVVAQIVGWMRGETTVVASKP